MSDQPPPYPEYPEYPQGGGQPPPQGNYPPPPGGYPPQQPGYPPQGGSQPWGQYQPPGYSQPAYGPAYPGGPSPYAGWWHRVGGAVIDGLISGVVFGVFVIIGMMIAFRDAWVDSYTDDVHNVDPLGFVIIGIGFLVFVAIDIWNRGLRVGTKGQSLGKQLVGIRVVRAQDGNLLGAGSGFLRWLITFLFGLISCVSIIDVLWPLWDDKNQTLHDKVVGAVALRA